MGIVDVIGVNTWLAVTLDLASYEFQGHLKSPEVNDLGWPHNDQWPIGIRLVGFPEVLNPNMWFIVDKNVSKPLLRHPLGQSSSFDQFEFWPLRRSQPAGVMPFYLGALRMLNVATGYSNYTLSCSELNGEHAGEGFRALRHILLPLWACKSQKCRFSRKFDLWPDLTRSNFDLGLKTIYAIARSRRDASTVFFPRSSTTIRGRSPGGGGGRTNPPSTGEGGEIRKTGEGTMTSQWRQTRSKPIE